ncbi:MAG TPA: ABATE domain-containing protein, partial [Ktedonobacterales bacterium]|nr:ABATE domain-containing protein [Ktedonobacterales bacterium]
MPAEAVDAAESDIQRYLRLLGGRACLDFVNTIEPRIGKHQRDFLLHYDDLVTWAEFAGILSPVDSKRQHMLSAQ